MIARSKEHIPISSEWYLDSFKFTYFHVFKIFVDQKVFKLTSLMQNIICSALNCYISTGHISYFDLHILTKIGKKSAGFT